MLYLSQATQDILLAISLFFLIFFLLQLVSFLAISFLNYFSPEDQSKNDDNINIFFTERLPPNVAISRKKNG